MQERDPEAGKRLRAAVQAAFGTPGRVKNPNQLHDRSGVARPTLDGYWEGVQPTTVNMRRMADALGVPPESLWLRWLGYPEPEPGLDRIAEEIRGLRDALVPVSLRGADAERRDSASEEDQGPEADDGPPAAPDIPPA